jgi:hypothetical protein
MSANPFGDSFVIDFEVFELDDGGDMVVEESLVRTVYQKDTVIVPILDPLPHLEAWSPRSDFSSLSTASSSFQEAFVAPIQWTSADLSMCSGRLLHFKLT